MKTLPLIITCLTLVIGCRSPRVLVPANTVNFKTQYGSLDLQHPQDTEMEKVDIEIGTNGTVHARIGLLRTKNSPEVIDKTAAGQVAILKQQGENMEKAFDAGAKAVGAVGGKAASTAAGVP